MQRRGLSRAVCTDEGDDFALFHLEGDSFDGMDRIIVNVEILHFQHVSHLLTLLPGTR